MKVKQYLEALEGHQDVTFIKARARKNAYSPSNHAEYQTTPIYTATEWLEFDNERIMNSVVLNDKQMPIQWLSVADWTIWAKTGRLKCLLIVSQEDFALLYHGQNQRDGLEEYIEQKLDVVMA